MDQCPGPFLVGRPLPDALERDLVERDLLGGGGFAGSSRSSGEKERNRLGREPGRARSRSEKLELGRFVSRLFPELARGGVRGALRSVVAHEPRRKREDATSHRRPVLLDQEQISLGGDGDDHHAAGSPAALDVLPGCGLPEGKVAPLVQKPVLAIRRRAHRFLRPPSGSAHSILAVLALIAPASPPSPTPTPGAPAADRIALLEKTLDVSPDNGGIQYELAVAEARVGRHADAIRWLEKAVSLGYDFDLAREPAFASLKRFEPYRELAHRLSLVTPVRSSELAFRIAEPDLVPEGIAYDPVSRAFFVGSLYKKKILRIGADGVASEFVAPGRDGLWSVLGLKVDARRRILWAASAADGREGTAAGSSALFAFDLPSGALRSRHVLESAPGRRHLLNDLALTASGEVFATDSETGAVYRLAESARSLEAWLPARTFTYPNGIALDAAERRLYVADFAKGLSIVEIATKRIRPVPHPPNVTVHAIDGLSLYGDSLVAVQNGPGMERIARLHIDATGERVTRLTVIESRNPDFDAPTTGAVAGNDYYYLANSQLEGLGEDGKLKSGVRFKDVLVLRAPLDASGSAPSSGSSGSKEVARPLLPRAGRDDPPKGKTVRGRRVPAITLLDAAASADRSAPAACSGTFPTPLFFTR